MKLTQTIHLSLIGSVLVLASCSRTDDDDQKDDDKDMGRRPGHSTHTHTWFPRYYYHPSGGSTGVRTTTPTHSAPSSPASGRGGFGSTGHAVGGHAGT
jgi:hypothetical protein